jgi:hypothetical protein
MKTKEFVVALFSIFFMFIAGCGGSGGGSGTTSSGGSGTLSVGITDAKPVIPGNPTELWVTFTAVRAHKPGGDWVTLPMPQTPLSINLLAFQNGKRTDLVPPVGLEPGKYTQLRFEISQAYMVINGSKIDLGVPSGFLRTDKDFNFDVPNGGAVDLTVDFDLSQSIVVTGSSQYKLKPVLHLVETKQAATIQGTIAAASFETATQAVVTVIYDKDGSGTVSDGDEEYTKVTVTKASDVDPTPFQIFWIVPNQNYIVQFDVNGDGIVEYEQAVPSSALPPGGTFTMNEAATIQGTIAAASFGTATQAVVTVIYDKDNSGTVSNGDEEYTKITVKKASDVDSTPFQIFWIVPNRNYVVQIDSNSDGTVDHTLVVPSTGVPPGGIFTLNGGAPI